MQLGRVCGQIVSTRKAGKLTGFKILVVQPISLETFEDKGAPFVSLDGVGAGDGELVMCVSGSSSRQTAETDARPVDNLIVAIIDSVDIAGKRVFDKFDPSIKPEAEQKTKAQPEPEIKTETVTEPEPEAEPETDPETQPEAEQEAEPNIETEAVAEPEAEQITEHEAVPEAQPEPEIITEAVAEPEPEAEPETQPEAEPNIETEAEPEAQREPGRAAEAAVIEQIIPGIELPAETAEQNEAIKLIAESLSAVSSEEPEPPETTPKSRRRRNSGHAKENVEAAQEKNGAKDSGENGTEGYNPRH